MTSHDTLDPFIASDLAALGTESRQHLPPLESSLAPSGAYRDNRAGAEARRDELLATRRLELSLMPLATGRIFVHRVARAAGGAAAALAAMFVVMMIADPMLVRFASLLVPELSVSLIAVGGLLVCVAVYAIAGLIAERAFERRMRAALGGTGDAFDDIDALAHGPLAEATRLNRALDGYATALPLLGFATCVPLLAYLSLTFNPLLAQSSEWSTSYRLVAHGWLAGNLGFVLSAMLIASVLAIIIGRTCHREHRELEPSPLLRGLGHWAVVPAAIVVGLLVLVFLGRALTGLEFGHLPTDRLRTGLAVGGTLAVFAPATWIVLFIRRSEQKRLDALGE